MTKRIPSYLKLHVEDGGSSNATTIDEIPGLLGFCLAFESATGWSLEVDTDSFDALSQALENSESQGSVRLLKPATLDEEPQLDDGVHEPPLKLSQAQLLADAAGELVAEVHRSRREVWRREAELAAGVPVRARGDEEAHLAARLEAILKGGAEAVGCTAAAIYLLDDATTELKMRSCWGLPSQRLLIPARPLRGSVADLEALVGHAVVLEDTGMLPHWKVPEPFASAICVPVSTPSEPLGTLWMFCDQPREYTDEQTNLVEIIAGRISSELQREMLLTECATTKKVDQQLRDAVEWQRDHLPTIKPMLDDWNVAGRTVGESLGCGFYDWFVPADGSLAIAMGSANAAGLEASLTCAALQASVRSHAQHRHDSAQLVAQVNETLWSGSAGGHFASVFFAKVDPETGCFEYSMAGRLMAVVLGADGGDLISCESLPIGTDPENAFTRLNGKLEPGETLFLWIHDDAMPFDWDALAAVIEPLHLEPAEAILDAVCLQGELSTVQATTFLVLQRRRAEF